jgi:two-component system OmpR family sensor kinase
MRTPRSTAVPIALLVIAAVAVATAMQFAITFRGPPPRPAPVPIAQVAQLLRGEAGQQGDWRRLTVSDSADPPIGDARQRPNPMLDAQVAAALGVPAGDVSGLYDEPAFFAANEIRGDFVVGWHKGERDWRVARSERPPPFTHWHVFTLLAALLTLFALSVPAWFIAQRISRPIRDLAAAAKRARLGRHEPMPVGGPREVRELAQAIEAMQGRILHQAQGRSAMLAAIAHDLGTPLSRIAFWVEQLPETARERASADIDEMREMLGATVRFVRDDRAEATHTRLDLGSLIESLADDLSVAGTPVQVTAGERAVVRGDPSALRRLFANLIENAVRYGERARIGWVAEPGWVETVIEDDGPGFEAGRTERLFSPFVRGESSRNRATGGTGLGLAIVRSIAEAHGGEVTLENRAEGGGRARVRLPAR